jgi:hypothetical protein
MMLVVTIVLVLELVFGRGRYYFFFFNVADLNFISFVLVILFDLWVALRDRVVSCSNV